jgi:hypothetical protein
MRGRNPPLFTDFKYMIMNTLKESLEKYQLNAGKTYMNYEQDKYSAYQNYLYKRAMYGLQSITKEELATMCSKKKQRIVNVYKRAQTVLNIAKQKATINYTNFLFKTLFPNSPFTDMLISCTEVDEKFKNTMTFKDLGMTKDQIVELFIQEGVLPKNFMSLTINPNQLPRLKTKL